ncbi:MAG TPA: putative selenate ABC transporter substrate-binding protein [Gemmatimonadota bacterium]|nr:putative selenate ABC transporter substrate-binding protein [Gemmatimonadota bacterium]
MSEPDGRTTRWSGARIGRWPFLAAALVVGAVTAAACSGGGGGSGGGAFTIGAIPDQDPEKLQRLFGKVADYLHGKLDVPVQYKPVTDYAAAVTAFRVGDLDMVWFGGLTGVQARLQVPGAHALAQRGIDEGFHSVFLANTSTDLQPIDSLPGLAELKGHTFTFGSQISTSGRLMPQYFLGEAGVGVDDFEGEPGFSGSHDKTIKLVESGTYDAGVANEQVWRSRVDSGRVDTTRVRVIWRTPPYHDYHWVIRPGLDDRFGKGFTDRVRQALLGLSPDDPAQKEILDLFGARRFVPTADSSYDQIEAVGRDIGKIQ